MIWISKFPITNRGLNSRSLSPVNFITTSFDYKQQNLPLNYQLKSTTQGSEIPTFSPHRVPDSSQTRTRREPTLSSFPLYNDHFYNSDSSQTWLCITVFLKSQNKEKDTFLLLNERKAAPTSLKNKTCINLQWVIDPF